LKKSFLTLAQDKRGKTENFERIFKPTVDWL